MKIITASKNPGKIEGVRKAFEHYYPDINIMGVSVRSDVSNQPLNDQILIGARNRVNNLKIHCLKEGQEADYYTAIESGITNRLGSWMITNVAFIEDKNGLTSFGTSPSFPVPDHLVD